MKFVKPQAKYRIGERVNVRCEEAGNPPFFTATIFGISCDKDTGKAEYCVMEDDGSRTDGYTEAWLWPADNLHGANEHLIKTSNKFMDSLKQYDPESGVKAMAEFVAAIRLAEEAQLAL